MPIIKTFNYTGLIDTFTVPVGVSTLTIKAVGACGGRRSYATPGRGASLQGDFSVTPGDELRILVGGKGIDALYFGGGGGGGSFVWLGTGSASTGNILVAAGGGGGAAFSKNGVDAVLTQNGASGNPGGDGGSDGNGGKGGYVNWYFDSGGAGGGGGGISTSGENGLDGYNGSGGKGGQAISAGGAGGAAGTSGSPGGFGGGGGGARQGGGGGGGYSGGGGGGISGAQDNSGGGGGSINNGTNKIETAGVGTSDGQVIITYTPDAPLTKTVDFNDRVVGDKVNYTISWTVPEGLIVYDVIISDILPAGQSYDDNASPVPPSVIIPVIIWPVIPIINATAGPVTLVYSFRANIDSSSIPPYTEVQTNTGKVNWNSEPGIDPREESSAVDVFVRNPHVNLTKGVRNVSKGEVSFGNSTNAISDNVMEYSLIALNDGTADAYICITADQLGGLDPGTAFIDGSIVAPPGTTASYNIVSNSVTWNIPFLTVGNSLQLLFRVLIRSGSLPGTLLYNTGTTSSYSNVNLTFIYPPESSNTVSILIQSGEDIKLLSNIFCMYYQNNLILKLGDPVSSIVKLPLIPGVTGTPTTVAKVTVDTSFLHDPKIKLDFAINIIIPEGAAFSNLTFKVFKFCFNRSQKIPVGNEWYFKNSSVAETASILSFFVYDYDTLGSKYCTYILEVTPYI